MTAASQIDVRLYQRLEQLGIVADLHTPCLCEKGGTYMTLNEPHITGQMPDSSCTSGWDCRRPWRPCMQSSACTARQQAQQHAQHQRRCSITVQLARQKGCLVLIRDMKPSTGRWISLAYSGTGSWMRCTTTGMRALVQDR